MQLGVPDLETVAVLRKLVALQYLCQAFGG